MSECKSFWCQLFSSLFIRAIVGLGNALAGFKECEHIVGLDARVWGAAERDNLEHQHAKGPSVNEGKEYPKLTFSLTHRNLW